MNRIHFRLIPRSILVAIGTVLIERVIPVAVAVLLVSVALAALALLRWPMARLYIRGTPAQYRLTHSTKNYLVGLKTNVVGHPADTWQWEDIANVRLLRAPGTSDELTFNVRMPRFIRVRPGSDKALKKIRVSRGRSERATVFLDARGHLLARNYTPSPELPHLIDFMVPSWPSGNLRFGQEWDEPVQWFEQFGAWKIAWTGTLHWKVRAFLSVPSGSEAYLSYTADLTPVIQQAPKPLQAPCLAFFRGNAQGEALIDLGDAALISNSFHYKGVLALQPNSAEVLALDNTVTISPP